MRVAALQVPGILPRRSGVLLLVLSLCSCKRDADAGDPPTAGSGDSAVATPHPGAAASALAGTARRPAVDQAALKRPPPTPPSDAQPGPAGVRWQLLRQGTGRAATVDDTLIADYTLWLKDGEIAYTSYTNSRPRSLSVSKVGKQFHSLISAVLPGGRARYWVPRAAMQGWRPDAWPDADLVIDLEVYELVSSERSTPLGPQPLLDPPERSGAGADALSTPSGIKYQLFESGSGAGPTKATRIHLSFQPWVAHGLVMTPIHDPRSTVLSIDSAPKPLAEVLSQAKEGAKLRAWLPKDSAAEIVPEAGKQPIVLDLVVRRLEKG